MISSGNTNLCIRACPISATDALGCAGDDWVEGAARMAHARTAKTAPATEPPARSVDIFGSGRRSTSILPPCVIMMAKTARMATAPT